MPEYVVKGTSCLSEILFEVFVGSYPDAPVVATAIARGYVLNDADGVTPNRVTHRTGDPSQPGLFPGRLEYGCTIGFSAYLE